ncbi:chaperone NapD [Helicobacter sp. 23-1045]
MNISSIIIKANDLERTADNLRKIEGVEVALMEGNTIIATIEAEDTSGEIALLEKIEKTQGVISAAMHYTYFEDDLRDEIAQMNSTEAPEKLNDDSIPIEQMPYSGSVERLLKKSREK